MPSGERRTAQSAKASLLVLVWDATDRFIIDFIGSYASRDVQGNGTPIGYVIGCVPRLGNWKG